jgi:EmrB/QacA subfamily drug resistance transporter
MRKWWPLVAVCAGAFMLLIDVTIVNVALPDMARALHTTFSDLQWVIDLYALVLAALVLTVGSVADRFGRRRLYVLGLVVFAASSLTCGLAPNVGVLIAARGVQGLGAAAMFATTMALISNSYSGRDRGVAFGVWGAVNGAAAAAGPIIGGLLTTHFGWRWIFLVNLPVSVVAVALTLVVVAESRDPHPRGVDLSGMVSFTVAAAALTYALIRGAWGSAATLGLLGVAVVAVVVFVLAERHRADPMLDLSLLRNRTFAAMLIAGGLLSAAAWASMAYLSLWLQSVLGESPIQAGLVVLPSALGAFAVSAAIGRVLHTASPRLLIGTGLLLIGAGALAQAVIRANSSWPVVLPGLALVGIGAGLSIAALSATAMAAVPHSSAGMAGGAVSTFRQLGYAFGIAVLGQVFRSGLSHAAGPALAGTLSGGEAGAVMAHSPGLTPLVHRAFADGLDIMFCVAAGVGVVAGILVFAMVRPRRSGGGSRPAWAPKPVQAQANAEAGQVAELRGGQHYPAGEVAVSRTLEGRGHRLVGEVGIGLDRIRAGLGDQDACDLGEDVADVAVAAVFW